MAGETRSSGEGVRKTAGFAGWIDSSLLTLVTASLALTVFSGLVQVSYGSYSMTLFEAWAAVVDTSVALNADAWMAFLFDAQLPEMSRQSLIVWNIRLPRVVVGVFVGANLAVSGAIFQAVTRNELASPYILGVSSGAGLAVLLSLVAVTGFVHLLPIAAAVGGTIAFVIVYAIAWDGGTNPVRLVLAGIIVDTVFKSMQKGLWFFADDIGVVKTALAWITGSLTGAAWEQVVTVAPWSLLALPIALLGARHLNVLVLGEETAQSLGMRVEHIRFGLSGVAIALASSAIAVAGIVGFVGLIVPHVVRTVVGSDYRRVVVGSLFVGPALLVSADVGARLGLSVVGFVGGILVLLVGLAIALGGTRGSPAVIGRYGPTYHRPAAMALGAGAILLILTWISGGPTVSDTQLPVGIVTGLVGGPYFLYLMRRRSNLGDL